MAEPSGAERRARVEAALDELLDLPAELRPAALDELARQDASLAAAVSGLLAAEDEAPAFLDSDALEVAAPALGALLEDDTAGPFAPGDLLGPYRLVRPLGRGGMSQVYLAEREDGEIRQSVAIKLLGPLAASPDFLARFRAERQILAALRHPGIARVLDAGTAAGGIAYLVMELIDGLAIDAFCRSNGLGLSTRLELFEDVCRAVEAAHRRLVVHRDLKPSNILVTTEGSEESAPRPRVKLLDFGIAKLLDPASVEISDAPLTRTGLLLLTPEYAAPEQLRGEPVSIAADVYSLGVVLYELVAGRRPHDLSGLAPGRAEAVVSEVRPTPPSAIVTGAGDRPGSNAWRRRLAGDLDTVILKALEKGAEERYASVGELRRDLERHRQGLPIEARPATLRYRAKKFLRRRRWPVAVAAAALLASLAFVAALLDQRATTARERDRAQEESERAQVEAAKAGRIKDFLLGLFRASSPREALGRELTAKDLLERGAERADALAAEPVVQAELLSVLGTIHNSLGRSDEAYDLLARALELRRQHLGENHPEVAEAQFGLAMASWRRGDLAAAEAGLRRSLAAWEASGSVDAIRGKRRLGRLVTDRGNYPEAERLLAAGLAEARARWPGGDLETAHLLRNLAILREGQERFEDAAELLVEARRLAEAALEDDDPAIDAFTGSLSAMLFQLERYPEAEALAREAIVRTLRAYGREHPYHAFLLGNLALAVKAQGRLEEAEAANLEALEIRRAALGDEHPDVALSLNNLGSLAMAQGRIEHAEELLLEALGTWGRTLGEDNPSLLHSLSLLAELELGRGRPRAAAAYLERAQEISALHLGEEHPETRRFRDLLEASRADATASP